MTRKTLLAVSMVTMIMSGCAQKKVSTVDADTAVNAYDTTTAGDVTATSGYDNVDPYGSGYGQNANGKYNGDNGYAGSGLKNIYFNPDQYIITSDKLSTISQNARILKEDLRAGGKVKIEGHCDASGSDEYNYALGLRRAKAAKDTLSMQGISSNKITLVSMGESSPECMDDFSASCYGKNRRVEFKEIQ